MRRCGGSDGGGCRVLHVSDNQPRTRDAPRGLVDYNCSSRESTCVHHRRSASMAEEEEGARLLIPAMGGRVETEDLVPRI